MIINMTPHPINVIDTDDECYQTFPSEGTIRLAATTVPDEPIDEIPTSRTQFGEAEGLPEETDDVFYIVSQIVKNALPERRDLLVPAEVVRDEEGKIIGCRSLGR